LEDIAGSTGLSNWFLRRAHLWGDTARALNRIGTGRVYTG
jgi:hypothetical protein